MRSSTNCCYATKQLPADSLKGLPSCVLHAVKSSVLLAVERYFAYQVKGIDVLYMKTKCYFRNKRISKNLDTIFEKNRHFAYSFFVIDGKIIVDIASRSAYHFLHTNMIFANF